MNQHKKIAVLGGDARTLSLVSTLAELGFECAVWGMGAHTLHRGAVRVRELSDAVRGSAAVILPTPASRDSLTLNSPLYEGDAPKLKEIFDLVPMGAPIIGGSLSPSIKSELERRDLSYHDIVEREDFARKNAIPTVEGAIAIAIRETARTLAGSRVLVCGLGRIGKRLADTLTSLGADVTVATRKKDASPYRCVHTARMTEGAENYDIVFNTAPARIFSAEFLTRLKNDCTVIDLASAPYGADRAAAEALGVKYIIAPALPGKYSPESAGIIIGECAADILREGGIAP